jgi:hypothetical protein
MSYKHGEYMLYVKHIELRGNKDKKYPMYFFSKKIPKSGEQCDLPQGYIVKVNERTGLPFLKRG